MTSIDRRLGCVRYHNPRENSRELPTRLPRENRRDVLGRRTPSRDAAARARPHDCPQIMPSTAPPRDADRVIVRVSAVDDANGGRGGGVARDAGGNPARTTNPWANEDAVVNVSLETPRREDGLGDAASASASAGGTRRKTSISSSDDPTPEWLKALAREDRPDARFKVPARWVTPFRGSMIWWLAPAFRFVQIVFAALAIAVVASMNSDASVAFPEARPRSRGVPSFATSPARFLGFASDAPARRLSTPLLTPFDSTQTSRRFAWWNDDPKRHYQDFTSLECLVVVCAASLAWGVLFVFVGAFYTLVPIRPRRRGERRSLRTFPGVSLRPPLARFQSPPAMPFNAN